MPWVQRLWLPALVVCVLAMILVRGAWTQGRLPGGAKEGAEMMELSRLQQLTTQPRASVLRDLGIGAQGGETGVAYGGLAGLVRVHEASSHPAFFFFRGEHVALIYASDSAYLAAFTVSALREHLGEPALELRSRAGKASVLAVYPAAGVAFSFSPSDSHVEFLEVFPATTADTYQRDIYREPAAFSR